MKQGEIDHRFAFHAAPDEEKRNAHTSVRSAMEGAAQVLEHLHPHDCREKSLAITHLEEAMFWGNAALARHDNEGNPS